MTSSLRAPLHLHPSHERFVQLLIDSIAAVHARHPGAFGLALRPFTTRPSILHGVGGVPGTPRELASRRRATALPRRRRSRTIPAIPGWSTPRFHPARDVPPRQSPRGPRARRTAPSPPRERRDASDRRPKKSRRRMARPCRLSLGRARHHVERRERTRPREMIRAQAHRGEHFEDGGGEDDPVGDFVGEDPRRGAGGVTNADAAVASRKRRVAASRVFPRP